MIFYSLRKEKINPKVQGAHGKFNLCAPWTFGLLSKKQDGKACKLFCFGVREPLEFGTGAGTFKNGVLAGGYP
jgi:hypothetical protein